MPTLLVATSDGTVVRRVSLERPDAHSIGRSPRCDIPLDIASISRRHALLFPFAGSWFVADTGSQLGLRSPEGPCRITRLAAEHWVGLGPLVLWLVEGAAARSQRSPTDRNADSPAAPEPSDEADDHRDLDDSGEHPGIAGELLLLERAAEASARKPGLAGSSVLAVMDLTGLRFATVGTDPSCGIRLPDAARPPRPLVAVLYREPRQWVAVAAGGELRCDGQRFLRKRLSAETPVEIAGLLVRLLVPERPVEDRPRPAAPPPVARTPVVGP
jgi:hypothetical protein